MGAQKDGVELAVVARSRRGGARGAAAAARLLPGRGCVGGAGAWRGKVIKGLKMAGQLGNERVTVRNAKVVKVDAEKNLIFVRGGVPGHRNGIVRIRSAVASR